MSKATSGFMTLRFAGDQYLIPDDAVPYLGGALDPRLFDVSYLARAKAASPHATALPMTVTRTAGGAPTAMSAAQATQLGKELADNWHAGHTRPATLSGFANVRLAPRKDIPLPTALPSPAAANAASRDLPHHTLTLDFVGTDGKPGAGSGWVQNLENARFGTFFIWPDAYLDAARNRPGLEGKSGPLKFSVPEGTYSLQFAVLTKAPATWGGADAALVIKPEVKVDSDMTVTLDARDTVPYHAAPATPVSHTGEEDTLSYYRGSATGGACGTNQTNLIMGLLSQTLPDVQATKLSVSPVEKVSAGTLGFVASTTLGSGTTDGKAGWPTGPEYDMNFPYWGSIPSSLTFAVKDKDFTTARQELHVNANSDCPSTPGNGFRALEGYALQPWGDHQSLLGSEPWLNDPNSQDIVTTLFPPGTYTYHLYSGNPKLSLWQFRDGDIDDCEVDHEVDGPRFASAPGKQITETWNKGPGVPAPAALPVAIPLTSLAGPEGSGQLRLAADPSLTIAPAVRQGRNGMVYLGDSDSDPGHYGHNYATSTVSFYRDGDLVASGGNYPYRLDLPLLSKPADYRLDWTWNNGVQAAAKTTASWRFHSAPADPATKLPSGEQCMPDPELDCSALPLLFVNYDLPLDLNNQAKAGAPLSFGLAVSHQPGEAAPSGVSATVSASFDDGKTWSAPHPVTDAGDGKLTATIDQPQLADTNGFASLRVTVTDGAGNSVTETTIRAYGLTS